jgi:hypothetical protein
MQILINIKIKGLRPPYSFAHRSAVRLILKLVQSRYIKAVQYFIFWRLKCLDIRFLFVITSQFYARNSGKSFHS